MAALSREDLEKSLEIVDTLRQRRETNRLAYFRPYAFQETFHAARDDAGRIAYQRLLMAGNQVGKTFTGANEVAAHATGLYPDWWRGHRFSHPVLCWVGGNSNYDTRDIVQAELLGEPGNPEEFGTGAIPRDKIVRTERKEGVSNAVSAIYVRHVSGGTSKIALKSYEQGATAWMGKGVHFVWGDEEPPRPIYSQMLRATTRQPGAFIMLTFTPENGMTDVVAEFRNDRKPAQQLVMAGWDDAPHITPEKAAQILEAMPPHEREMRSRGVPVIGSGLVYPVPDEQLMVDPFEVPRRWPRIAGIDFGWDHPTSVVWCAWDRDADVVYVYDSYRARGQTPLVHAAAIKPRGRWVPVAWPHDGGRQAQDGPNAGQSLAEQFRAEGLNMLGAPFANPEGGNAVEPGIYAVLMRMQTGRLKAFSTLSDWFEEKRMYHRSSDGSGRIIKSHDDLMDATRYAVQSLRFARHNEPVHRPAMAGGVVDYDPLAAEAF